jgi:hypothetical protein
MLTTSAGTKGCFSAGWWFVEVDCAGGEQLTVRVNKSTMSQGAVVFCNKMGSFFLGRVKFSYKWVRRMLSNHNEIGRKIEPGRYVLRHIFFALDEMSLELPGGATMECIWLEPGIFTIGRPPSDDELLSLEGTERPVSSSWGYWLGKIGNNTGSIVKRDGS